MDEDQDPPSPESLGLSKESIDRLGKAFGDFDPGATFDYLDVRFQDYVSLRSAESGDDRFGYPSSQPRHFDAARRRSATDDVKPSPFFERLKEAPIQVGIAAFFGLGSLVAELFLHNPYTKDGVVVAWVAIGLWLAYHLISLEWFHSRKKKLIWPGVIFIVCLAIALFGRTAVSATDGAAAESFREAYDQPLFYLGNVTAAYAFDIDFSNPRTHHYKELIKAALPSLKNSGSFDPSRNTIIVYSGRLLSSNDFPLSIARRLVVTVDFPEGPQHLYWRGTWSGAPNSLSCELTRFTCQFVYGWGSGPWGRAQQSLANPYGDTFLGDVLGKEMVVTAKPARAMRLLHIDLFFNGKEDWCFDRLRFAEQINRESVIYRYALPNAAPGLKSRLFTSDATINPHCQHYATSDTINAIK